jgi:hypothetical protein
MWIAIGGQWPHGMVLLHREGDPICGRDARLILWRSLHKRLGRAGDEVRAESYIASAGFYPGLSPVALVVPA